MCAPLVSHTTKRVRNLLVPLISCWMLLSDEHWLLQVHGNVCLASVVVTQTLDWKLHAFDVLSEFDGHSEAATGPLLVINLFQYDP